MRLSVVVVNWNSRDDLRACLLSLRSQTQADLEVIVVDNGSNDGSGDMTRADFPECILLRQTENLGFAEACNRGIEASTGEWVAMLNNDAVAEPDWAKELARAAESCEATCGMLQSLLLFQDRPHVINSTGIELTPSGGGRDRDEGRTRQSGIEPELIFCPTAGAAAYRRSMLESIKLPEGYFESLAFYVLRGSRPGMEGASSGLVRTLHPALRRLSQMARQLGPSWPLVARGDRQHQPHPHPVQERFDRVLTADGSQDFDRRH